MAGNKLKLLYARLHAPLIWKSFLKVTIDNHTAIEPTVLLAISMMSNVDNYPDL